MPPSLSVIERDAGTRSLMTTFVAASLLLLFTTVILYLKGSPTIALVITTPVVLSIASLEISS